MTRTIAASAQSSNLLRGWKATNVGEEPVRLSSVLTSTTRDRFCGRGSEILVAANRFPVAPKSPGTPRGNAVAKDT